MRSTNVDAPIGVLLMAYGSPESVDDMHAYLLDIRGGRETPEELVEEIKERYEAIGGRSPLLERTKEQAQALEEELNKRKGSESSRFWTYIGMRHWEPRIREAVEQMSADGITQAVALVLAPHSSRMSTGAYFSALDQAMEACGSKIDVIKVSGWHDHPGLIEAIADKVERALDRFEDEQPHVIFTAHSLPVKILEQGDTYDSQLRETSRLLAVRLALPADSWEFCYQSAGQSAIPWLGPQIEEVVVERIEEGERNLLVVPIGFVSDHVEVLYDIDIACRELAEHRGARLERSESLNASPLFVSALATLVLRSLPYHFSEKEA